MGRFAIANVNRFKLRMWKVLLRDTGSEMTGLEMCMTSGDSSLHSKAVVSHLLPKAVLFRESPFFSARTVQFTQHSKMVIFWNWEIIMFLSLLPNQVTHRYPSQAAHGIVQTPQLLKLLAINYLHPICFLNFPLTRTVSRCLPGDLWGLLSSQLFIGSSTNLDIWKKKQF